MTTMLIITFIFGYIACLLACYMYKRGLIERGTANAYTTASYGVTTLFMTLFMAFLSCNKDVVALWSTVRAWMDLGGNWLYLAITVFPVCAALVLSVKGLFIEFGSRKSE